MAGHGGQKALFCRRFRLLLTALALAAIVVSPSPSFPETQSDTQFSIEALKKLSIEELFEQRVTTVTLQETSVERSAAAVSVINRDEILRSGTTTIPDLLRRIPGLDVAQLDGNKWAVSSRGFNDRFAHMLLVQIDGRAVNSPLFSGVYWDLVDYPLEDIERIEVLRGPASSMVGANAVNGVINIVTRSAQDTKGVLATVGAGDEERVISSVRYGGQAGDRLFYRVYGQGRDRDDQFSATVDPNDHWQDVAAGVRMDWTPEKKQSVTLDAGYLHSIAGRDDLRAQSEPPFVFRNLEDERSDAAHLLFDWNRKEDESSCRGLRVYWDHVGRQSDNGYVDQRFETVDALYRQQLKIGGRHQIVYTAGFRAVDADLESSSRDQGFSVSLAPSDRRSYLFSSIFMDQIAIIPRELFVIFSSEVEHNSFTGFELQPSARVLWTPFALETFWFSVSRAVRTPDFVDDSSGSTLVPFRISQPHGSSAYVFPMLVSTPEVGSENLISYEAGARSQPIESFSFDAAIFASDYDSLVSARPGGGLQPGPRRNTFILPLSIDNSMEGHSYGLEGSVNWQLQKSWGVYAAYTYLTMKLRAGPGTALPTVEVPEKQSPRNQLFLAVNWSPVRSLDLDLAARCIDRLSGLSAGLTAGNVSAIPAYWAVDFRIAWRPRQNMEFSVAGRNLIDNHHPESVASALLTVPLIEIERSVFAKFSWGF